MKKGILIFATAMLMILGVSNVAFASNSDHLDSIRAGLEVSPTEEAVREDLFDGAGIFFTILKTILFLLGVITFPASLTIFILAIVKVATISPERKTENGETVEVWHEGDLERKSFWNGAIGIFPINLILQIVFQSDLGGRKYWGKWFKGFLFAVVLSPVTVIFLYAILNFILS